MSDNNNLQLSGTENVWFDDETGELTIYQGSTCIIYPPEFVLLLLGFLKGKEDEIFHAVGADIPSYFEEDMDGDFDSGMTSAGHGTDEDYGYYGEDEEPW